MVCPPPAEGTHVEQSTACGQGSAVAAMEVNMMTADRSEGVGWDLDVGCSQGGMSGRDQYDAESNTSSIEENPSR